MHISHDRKNVIKRYTSVAQVNDTRVRVVKHWHVLSLEFVARFATLFCQKFTASFRDSVGFPNLYSIKLIHRSFHNAHVPQFHLICYGNCTMLHIIGQGKNKGHHSLF